MGDEQAGRAGASLGARPREEPSCCRALVTRACGRDSSLPGRHFDFFLVTAAFLRVTPLPNCSLGARRARGRRGGRGEGRPRQCGRPVCWCRSQSRPSPALSSSIRGRDAAGGGGGCRGPHSDREDVNCPKASATPVRQPSRLQRGVSSQHRIARTPAPAAACNDVLSAGKKRGVPTVWPLAAAAPSPAGSLLVE